MPSYKAPRCNHVKSNGIQCGSPALKDNQFCYYHQHCHSIAWNYQGGSYRNCSESTLTLPVFEDAHSIQLTLRHVVEFILQHRIDDKKAGLVLYALQMASSNLKRLESEAPKPDEMVTDPPFDPVCEFEEEEERDRQAQHAEFEKTFPLDPKPADRMPLPVQSSGHNIVQPSSKGTANKDSQLPLGTIHACIDESPTIRVDRRRAGGGWLVQRGFSGVGAVRVGQFESAGEWRMAKRHRFCAAVNLVTNSEQISGYPPPAPANWSIIGAFPKI